MAVSHLVPELAINVDGWVPVGSGTRKSGHSRSILVLTREERILTRSSAVLHILEQLGATTILRTVCKIGRDTRFKAFPDALRVLRKTSSVSPRIAALVIEEE